MWLWLKTIFARFMVAIGIDWPTMGDGDKLQAVVGTFLGIVGVGLALVGVVLARRQSLFTQRQAMLAQKEDEYLTEQRSRKEKLELRLFLTDDEHKLYIAVTNTGNRTAQTFYWQFLRSASELSEVEQYDVPVRPEERIAPWGSDVYRVSSGYVSTPLYPGRSIICAVLRVDPQLLKWWRGELGDRVGICSFRWSVTSEAGRFPNAEDWPSLPLEPDDGPHPQYEAHLFQ